MILDSGEFRLVASLILSSMTDQRSSSSISFIDKEKDITSLTKFFQTGFPKSKYLLAFVNLRHCLPVNVSSGDSGGTDAGRHSDILIRQAIMVNKIRMKGG